ncbi:uncharacterized protein LOC142497724 isoform X2 [Ascaphus truei]|uniref:uncharacterized protein LOC142497724 isoform X2 n=1 Tax=Ascaphus truei TaxID=8439 RepID=UPI003F597B61
MNRRRGWSRLLTLQRSWHQTTKLILLLLIILTLSILWLVPIFQGSSHSMRSPYTHSLPQVTIKEQAKHFESEKIFTTPESREIQNKGKGQGREKEEHLHQKTTSELRVPVYKENVAGINEDEEYGDVDDTCPVFRLTPSANTSDKIACKRTDFVPGSCRLMKTLFRGRPANCSHQPSYIICEIKDYNPKKPKVFCHHNICKKCSPVFIGLYLSEIGEYTWHKLHSTEELASFVNSELLVDFQNHYSHMGYCLIQCTNEDGKFISQLLILPPIFRPTSIQFRSVQSQSPLLNVNILLLDSLSRHHFYRTLPKTIKTFIDLNEHRFKSGHVFDFELVQGIKGRTFESLQALFGGDATTLPIFNAFELPPKRVDLIETLGKFKAHSYETLYMEDMCWLGEWGLVKEQRAMNLSAPYSERVKLFNEAVHRAGIDRVDVSYSSCLVLQENKVKDVFHGPDSICYNGIHQHTYFFQYMEYFISRFSSLHKPTFTFLILDTSHEDTGIRIKQLDEDLAIYTTFLAHQTNTVSFILSDHGNTYGRFVSASSESQVEVFHPLLFVMVPDEASKILGDGKMKSLDINQNRLVSLIDVHYTLKGLLPYAEKVYGKLPKYNINIDGLLSPVSPARTCRDIPRIHPNLCICQASYTLERNNSYYALFAEFALGYMNRQVVELQTGNSEGTCLKLIAIRFDSIKRSTQDSLSEATISLDLYVKHAGMVNNEEERFTVTVLFSSAIHMEGILFLGYNRMTPYSTYRQCADPAVDIRLCICEREHFRGNKTSKTDRDYVVAESVLWTRTYRSVVHKPCLYLLTRNYTAGVVLSICNICFDMQYNIHFDFLTINLHSSSKMPISQVIGPKMEKLLVVRIRKVEHLPWKYKYTVNFKAFPL